MADYTSPFFGDRDLGQYTCPSLDVTVLPNRNRGNQRKVNDKGQVYEADIFYQTTYHEDGGRYVWNMRDDAFSSHVIGSKNSPKCILALPISYGNLEDTAKNGINEYWTGLVKYMHDAPTFFYLLIGETKGARIELELPNENSLGNKIEKIGRNSLARLVSSDVPEYGEYPIAHTVETGEQSETTWVWDDRPVVNAQGRMDAIERFLNNLNGIARNNSYDPELNTMSDGKIAALRTYISHWKERPNNIIDNIYFYFSTYFSSSFATHKFIGQYIATGLPVFTLDNFEEMVKYFEGENWKADNDDDVPPPKDWSTDWKIYIKGAQRPDIWVTMSSPKVDEWLANLAENVSGATKEDITVEYRYREYELDAGGIMGALPKYTDRYTVKRLGADNYNNTKATSYGENIVLNFPLISSIAGGLPDSGGGGEFSDYDIENLKNYYAELGFRLKYGKYKSTWCRYEIGVIGSPSVPDFSEMHNIGTQDDGWQDESTVVLIYDQIPEGEDPYPDEPEPDLPKPKPTDPTPSDPTISGLGLLTTTYKITNANAQALGRFFWGGDLFEKIKALNMSPIENVVGLVMMPINVAGTPSVITIGDVDTNINGDVIKSVPLYELGSIELKGRYGSFLDYEPYTSAFLFLPFVGFVRLDPAYFTNKTLKVVYAYDIICGLCKAMLFANGIYVESHQGQCGIEIPLIASNRSQLQLSLASSLMESTANAATGNFAAAAGQLGSGIANYVSGFHTNRQGNYSPTTAWNETRECFIVIESVNASRSSSFAHDYGLPCAATYNIGQLSGFTQCAETVDVRGISGATEEEKAEIYTLLTGGFFA